MSTTDKNPQPNTNKRQYNTTENLSNNPKKRPRHGNYSQYYARRNTNFNSTTDDRLSLIHNIINTYPKTYISILDIGCNDGSLTIQVAKHTRCASITAIDIDFSLIKRARATLRKTAMLQQKQCNYQQTEPLVSLRVIQGRLPAHVESNIEKQPQKSDQINNTSHDIQNGLQLNTQKPDPFPYNIMFRHDDIAKERPTRTSNEKQSYDMVLCLSVTKWIHIEGGDIALKRLFQRIYDVLKPGGCLILEPQLKQSYKLARQKGLAPKDVTFKQLKLHPEKFSDYLLSAEGGFERMEMLRDVREKGQAFNRPVIAFYKKE